ncbi:class I SAM-dependent methyltransferase [Glutamicibacter sp. MNS18]|uniref:class I SAM-dependent methyltransferase n=1 Tax=Glutamicibacter sp. MNS18 TaxID=2989817 RepID=UPI0022361F64|nr:class I SAM-dependent methyltransferase [Glutamicibacter sp. MNS18]MCW4465158.1 class I SAM-dependent methyltransferase [Glutamicibacter sp. MNS18]
MSDPTPNWFRSGGDDYARYRPRYPERLVGQLVSLAPGRSVAVDVGCGNGQLTTMLAEHFDEVIGVDPSRDQIAHAVAHERARYLVAPAEDLPVSDACADLVTVAQAAHWFDLPRFYTEARRIAVPGAIIALLTYGEPILPSGLNPRFLRFARDEVGGYWPAEIRHVQQAYRSLHFPFDEVEMEPVDIELQLDLPQFLGYLSTWSAVRAAAAAGQGHLLEGFASELGQLWEDPQRVRSVLMPLHLRVGHLDGIPNP